MESSSWPKSLPNNRIKAIRELEQGQVWINKLQEMLGQPEKIEFGFDNTLVQIVGMFDRTLSILNSCSSNINEITQNRTHGTSSPNKWDGQRSEGSAESIKIVTPIKTKRGCYKRRKISSELTRVTSVLIDDGHAWRKYGEKVIMNSKYQRHYYRCTYKFEQGCQATKHVQKTDDEPPMYRTTYHRHHTCKNLQRSNEIILDPPSLRDNSVLLSFKTNTIVSRKQVGPFTSSTNHKPKEGFPCLSTDYNEHSLSNYIATWDPVTQSSQIPLETKSMMSSGLDQDDMVSSGVFSSTCSTDQYEKKCMLKSHDFGDSSFL